MARSTSYAGQAGAVSQTPVGDEPVRTVLKSEIFTTQPGPVNSEAATPPVSTDKRLSIAADPFTGSGHDGAAALLARRQSAWPELDLACGLDHHVDGDLGEPIGIGRP